jgi:SAM-dependent methyltransferase
MAGANAFYASGLGVATYDLFAAQPGPLTGDVGFYVGCAGRAGGPVLELGTGTGRVAWPLAAAGYTVVGLDLSESMLALARQKAETHSADVRDRMLFRHADMVDFSVEDSPPFALVLIPSRAFAHLVTPEEQRATLRCIHRHLASRGHLVIDLFDPLLDYCVPGAPLPRTREVRDPATDHVIQRRTVARQTDPLRQVLAETVRFEAFDTSGAPVAAEETSWMLRWTYRQEMAYLLDLAGFEVLEQYSDFHGAPPAYGKEQVWIARKR